MTVVFTVALGVVVVACAVGLWRDRRREVAVVTDRVLDFGHSRHAREDAT